jgi:aryl-alcohol dehydrogenase-like predicted oxidoreductase
MAQTFGVGIIPWSPIAGGLLSGKYNRNDPAPADARYSNLAGNPITERRVKDKNRIFDVVEQLQPIAKTKGSTLAQLSLAWCAQQPGVTNPNHRATHYGAARGQSWRAHCDHHR